MDCGSQYGGAASSRLIQNIQRSPCELTVLQQPRNACSYDTKEKDRKIVDPPPVVQLKVARTVDPQQEFLRNADYFISCSLVRIEPAGQAVLTGNAVSSLHRLKDTENNEGAFFVFGDLSAKGEGEFRMEFNLFEKREEFCVHITSVCSEPFVVYPRKYFPGMMESTSLTRTFADQGVRLRLRKEPKTLLRKRGPASDDYEPRHYKTSNRKHSTTKAGDQETHSASAPQGESSTVPQQQFAPAYNLNQPAALAENYLQMQRLYNLQHNPPRDFQTDIAQQQNPIQTTRSYAVPQQSSHAPPIPAQAFVYHHFESSHPQGVGDYLLRQPFQKSRSHPQYENSGYEQAIHHPPGVYTQAMPQANPFYENQGLLQGAPAGAPRYMDSSTVDDAMITSPTDTFPGEVSMLSSSIPSASYIQRSEHALFPYGTRPASLDRRKVENCSTNAVTGWEDRHERGR